MMASAFSQFSLPEISAVARRTVLSAAVVGVVALVGLTVVGYGLIGLGLCVGLALALVNFRLISRSTIKQASSAKENKRRPLAMNTLGRLGVLTVVALGLVWLSHLVGLGAIVGLAIFQFMLLGNVMVLMVRAGRVATMPGDDGGAQ